MVSLFLTEIYISDLKIHMCTGTQHISKYTVNVESSSLSENTTQQSKIINMHKGLVRMHPVRVAWNWNICKNWASLVAQIVKNLPAMRKSEFNPRVKKVPWRREWLPTPVFLPGEFHQQRSLVGYH